MPTQTNARTCVHVRSVLRVLGGAQDGAGVAREPALHTAAAAGNTGGGARSAQCIWVTAAALGRGGPQRNHQPRRHQVLHEPSCQQA